MTNSPVISSGSRRSFPAVLRTLVIVVLSVFSLVIGATAASAATPRTDVVPFSATGCGGDACMFLSDISSGATVFVDAWAYNSTFFGHFDLTRNGSVIARSANITFDAGGNAWRFNNISAIVAEYCVVGWTSGGTFKGRACEAVE